MAAKRPEPRQVLSIDNSPGPRPGLGRVQVSEGTQVLYDGVVYGGGELVDAPGDHVEQWLALGYVRLAGADQSRGR